MGLFSKKKTKDMFKEKNTTDNNNNEINERPRICCIDIEGEVVEKLQQSNFNIYNGTLGKKIRIPNKNRYDNHQILLQNDFPINIHEYDIFIIDLDDNEIIDYNSDEHILKLFLILNL